MNIRPIPKLSNTGNTCFISSSMWALSVILYRDAHFFDVFDNDRNSDIALGFLKLMNEFLFFSSDPMFDEKYYQPFVRLVRSFKTNDFHPFFGHTQHDPNDLFSHIFNDNMFSLEGQHYQSKISYGSQKISHCHNTEIDKAYSRPRAKVIDGDKINNVYYESFFILPIKTNYISGDKYIINTISDKKPIQLEHLIYNYALSHTGIGDRWNTERPPPNTFCDKDKSYESIVYHNFSDVIIIMLGRYYDKTNVSMKFNDEVDVPLSLDFGQFLANPEKKMYDLVSVVYHIGDSRNSGHYTALVNNRNQWFYCDDMSFGPKPINTESSDFKSKLQKGYILVYMKNDPSKIEETVRVENSIQNGLIKMPLIRQSITPELPEPPSKPPSKPLSKPPSKPPSKLPTKSKPKSKQDDDIALALALSMEDENLRRALDLSKTVK